MKQVILGIFHLICLLSTIIMASYCAYKFYLNEDNSVIEFESFDGVGKNIYPTISFCFYGDGMFDNKTIWNEFVTENTTKNIKPTNRYYERFLLGEIWAEEFLNISYNKVTPDWKRILRFVKIFSADERGDVNIYNYLSQNLASKTPFYESYRSPTDKCFSLDINTSTLKNLTNHRVTKTKIAIAKFFNGVFLKKNLGGLHLDIYLSYPNQLLRSFPIARLQRTHTREKSSKFKIIVHSSEIIERRNKYNKPCNENWKDDDNQIRDTLAIQVGCRHEFWTDPIRVPVCNEQSQHSALRMPRLITTGSSFMARYPPPCREIQSLISTTEETFLDESQLKNWKKMPKPFISFEIHFKRVSYKLIKSVPKFDGESLIGNLGGYLGLFLGFAIWQVPNLILKNAEKFKAGLKIYF